MLAHKELKMKETHFDPKFPDAGEHKVLYAQTISVCVYVTPSNLSFMQFSLRCTKYDRHGYKARKRIFMIMEQVSSN